MATYTVTGIEYCTTHPRHPGILLRRADAAQIKAALQKGPLLMVGSSYEPRNFKAAVNAGAPSPGPLFARLEARIVNLESRVDDLERELLPFNPDDVIQGPDDAT